MNRIEARTLNALRLIETGKVRWRTSGTRVRFLYADFDTAAEVARLSEDLYIRVNHAVAPSGSVALSDAGRRLLAELELDFVNEAGR